MNSLFRSTLLLGCVVGLAACSTTKPNLERPLEWLVPPGSVSDEPVLFAIDAVPDPKDAPLPTSDADAWVFAHLYEGLFEQQGSEHVPRLAKTCRVVSEDACWVELAPGLAFSDGTRLQAQDVVEAWLRTRQRHPFDPIWQWLDPTRATVSGNRISIEFSASLPSASESEAMALLSHPALRIQSSRPGMPYPVGTGPLLVGSSSGRELRCGPNPHYRPTQGTASDGSEEARPRWRDGRGREIVFRATRRSDPRDLVDSEFDGAWVRDREAVPFMEDVGWSAHPLPWDRIYVLRWPLPEVPFIDSDELAALTVSAEGRATPVPRRRSSELSKSKAIDAEVSGPGGAVQPRSLGGEETERAKRLLKEHGYGESTEPGSRITGLEDAARSSFETPKMTDAIFCVRGDRDGERIAARLSAVVDDLRRVVSVERGELLQALRAASAMDRAGLSYDAPGPGDSLVFAVRSNGNGGIVRFDLGPDPVGRLELLVETRGRFFSAPTVSGIYVDGHGVPRVEHAAKRVIGYGRVEPD